MSLGIEDKSIEWNKVMVVGKQKVEILESFRYPEAFHLVFCSDIVDVLYVSDGSVALLQSRVLFKRLEDLPAPVLIGFVSSQSVEIEEALYRLRSLQIVCVGRLREKTEVK